MTGYSFNRCRTAALKSISAMQDRLDAIALDFADVDEFLVSEAQICVCRLEEFAKELKHAQDPFEGERRMKGYILNEKPSKVCRHRYNKPEAEKSAHDPDLFARSL
jgi:hypothetical protein